ncbi:hypothetical protein [Flexibacterium corallicola]|nr:hypothetical protein [Pseudovibrio sp. M1P-2-3]
MTANDLVKMKKQGTTHAMALACAALLAGLNTYDHVSKIGD